MTEQAMVEQYKQILKNRNTVLIESNQEKPTFSVSRTESDVIVEMRVGGKAVDSIKFQQLNG